MYCLVCFRLGFSHVVWWLPFAPSQFGVLAISGPMGYCASLTSLGLHNSASDCLRLARIHSLSSLILHVVQVKYVLHENSENSENGCGPIAGNHWLNYVTPSLLTHRNRRRTPNWLGANGSHHTTWENPKRKHTRQYILNIETVQMDKFLRSGSKLIEAGDYTSIVWQPEGIMVVTIDLWETRMDPQGPMWHLLLQRE